MKHARRFAAAWLLWSLSLLALADAGSETRASYLAVIDRPRVALAPELAAMPAVEGLRKYHLWFSTDAKERVPGYLLLPDAARFKGPRPVVIALHGTGGNKDNGQIAEIVLKAARGQPWRFEEGDEQAWRRVPATVDPMQLIKK